MNWDSMAEETRTFLLSHDFFLFDVDDTLLWTFSNGFHKVNAAAAELGLAKITFERYRSLYGRKSFLTCLEMWFPGTDPQEFSGLYARQKERFPYKPVCEFRQIQQKAARAGIQCAILTNGRHDKKLTEKLLSAQTDINALSGVWGGEDLPEPKPSPRALEPVQARFPDARLLYIGDAWSDAQMARAAGIGFLQVCSGADPALPDTHTLSSLGVLAAYLY